jgi:hypothetical protein
MIVTRATHKTIWLACKLGPGFPFFHNLLFRRTRLPFSVGGHPRSRDPPSGLSPPLPPRGHRHPPKNVALSPSRQSLAPPEEKPDSGSEKHGKEKDVNNKKAAVRTTACHLSFISFFIPGSFRVQRIPGFDKMEKNVRGGWYVIGILRVYVLDIARVARVSVGCEKPKRKGLALKLRRRNQIVARRRFVIGIQRFVGNRVRERMRHFL